jgi:hypothetical protein
MNRMRHAVFLLLLPIIAIAGDKAMDVAARDHRWFDLRDAIMAQKSQPFYRLRVAAAFDDVRRAEKELPAVMRSGATPQQLGDTHYQLYRLYNRIGQYRKAAEEERKLWSISELGITPSEAAKADADALGNLPDLQVVSRRAATVSYSEWPGRKTVVIPVTINGQPMRFAMDTGAGMSVVTETLAQRLGLKNSPGQPIFDGITGKMSTGRYVVADRLKVGNTEFRNVSFTVLPDDLEVLKDIPTEERGAIGLPVLLGLETIRWNWSDHRLDMGFAPARATLRAANLAFEDLFPLMAVEIAGRRLSFEFDTGAEWVQLWPPFVKDFPDEMKTARESSRELAGATGGETRDVKVLAELRIRVAGFPIVLKDAPAMLTPTISASNLHYGLLAMDALSKANEVTLDFGAMRVNLR